MVWSNSVSVGMTQLVCGTCGVTFTMPTRLYNRKSEDHETYWCPNGHKWYVGKSDKERKIEQLEREVKWKTVDLTRAKKRANTAERSAAAYKGKFKSVHKRVTAGVCPHCRRNFKNLKNHMKCKHPKEVARAHGKKGS